MWSVDRRWWLDNLVKIKKNYFSFYDLLTFSNLGIETCNQDISKIIIASSFKRGQLVEDDK